MIINGEQENNYQVNSKLCRGGNSPVRGLPQSGLLYHEGGKTEQNRTEQKKRKEKKRKGKERPPISLY
jgi:hypothetical protein